MKETLQGIHPSLLVFLSFTVMYELLHNALFAHAGRMLDTAKLTMRLPELMLHHPVFR